MVQLLKEDRKRSLRYVDHIGVLTLYALSCFGRIIMDNLILSGCRYRSLGRW